MGVEKSKVVTAFDLLAGKFIVANKVVIIGGGLVGCETAEYVAERGCRDITIIEMLDNVAMDVRPAGNRDLLLERLGDLGVNIITSAKVTEILDDGILYEKNGAGEVISGVNNVILATGAKSINEIAESIKDMITEVYIVGDAKNPRKALEAIEEGALVGRSI